MPSCSKRSDSNMGVNTDAEGMGPGSTVTDELKQTRTACKFEQQHENGQSLTQDPDCDEGIQGQKPAKGTGIPLITSLQNMLSQHTSGALNAEHNEAQIEHTYGGDSVLSNTLVNLNTETSAYDKCVQLGECLSSLHPAEILETDTNDAWYAMYNTLNEISLSDASVFKQELPFNPDIDQIDEEGYGAMGTGIPLITPLQNIPSQHISGALITEHNKAQLEHTGGGYIILSNTTTSLRPDADIEDDKTELSHGALVNLNTDTSADDKCIILEELCSSSMQPGEIMEILEIDTNDDWDEMYNTLRDEMSSIDAGAFKLELPFNPDIDQVDEEGYTPLYKASLEGDFEDVDDLISRGANLNTPSEGGLRPLHAAAQEGHAHIVDFLIMQGADVSVECELGQTPFHTAAAEGYVDILESFIAEEANVNVEDNTGWTPFNAAVQYGHLEAVKYLMTEGAKQNTYDEMTKLYAAAQFGHSDIVKFFIDEGADVKEKHDEGMIPLHGAASGGHLEVMEYLIQQGSDVNKKDNTGWTPFIAAVQNGHLEAVKYLISKEAKQNRYDGMTPLVAAVHCGHLDIVIFFVDKGDDVNEEDEKGKTALHDAAAQGHLKVMEYLIQKGSDVNKSDAKGWTPFNAAVQYGQLGAVKYLITKGAKQNRYNGMTPICAAGVFGHLHIVEFFLFKGADVNKEDDKGMTPLHRAAARGHVKVMEYLIRHGSDMNKGDAKGWTPFNAAVQYGHLEAVKYLMTEGANQNTYDEMTKLYAAAQFGHSDIVEFFIGEGADVNEEDYKGRIPLHGAAARGHLKVMEYLIQQGSGVNKENNTGWTPFNAAVQYGQLGAVKYLMTKGAEQNRHDGMTPICAAGVFGHLHIVEFFLSKGADVNKEDDEGMTPLHRAAAQGHVKVMEYLIHHGSDMNKGDANGWTPFNAAVQYGHLEAVKYLMTKGAKKNRYNGMTPLYVAAYFGHLDIVKLIISNGADVNEEDDEGMIPLHGAACAGHLDVIEYVIEQGSDVNKKDNSEWTPFNAAVQYGHLLAVKYLWNMKATESIYNGITPLFSAARFGHKDVVKFLVSKGGDVKEGDGIGQTPLHGAAVKGDIEMLQYLIQQGCDVNKKDDTGRTPLNAAVQHGHLEAIKYLLTEGAEQNRYNGMTPLYAAAQFDHLHIVEFFISKGADVDEEDEKAKECIPSRRDNLDEEETGDPRTCGQQNLITRGYVTITMPDADTYSRTEQLTYQVDNAEDGNDYIQVENAQRGADELALKSPPTRTHVDEKGCNEQNNPFIHAKPKYPDKGEQEPTLDQMKAIKCIGTRKRNTTDCADGTSPLGPQTWQYSGFDPPYLQTMDNDDHLYGEPESRCHSLIDENKKMREYSSPMNARNDLPINETSVKVESFPTHPPAVVYQSSYDGNPVSTQGTSSNPVWKIGTNRRTSVDRCPSILALVQTFLQMMLALVIILAGSPVLVAGSDIDERVTLQAGKPGVIPFHFSRPPNGTFQGAPYYTLRIESNTRPFFINGEADIEGFKSPSQLPRFTTSVTDLDTSPCVNLMIDNVDTLDEDEYVLTAVWHSFENVRFETVKKKIDVLQIPPGPAKCFITVSVNDDYPYEVHCRATSGSVTTTISCYQNDQKIEVKGDITDNGQVTSGIFLLPHITHFSCCSHDITLNVSKTMCNDFELPPDMHNREPTTQIVDTVPTFVTIKNSRTVNERLKTTPTIQIESHVESGACRQFMLPSLWHFTYLPVYILAFVTI